MSQITYNPIDINFTWTADNWYSWDSKAATAEAKRLRDEHAKELKASGRIVRKSQIKNQLVSRGGIGSGRPHIEEIVTVFLIDVL